MEALSDYGFDTFWHDMRMMPRPSTEQLQMLQLRLIELFRLHGPDLMAQYVEGRQLKTVLGHGFEWVCLPLCVTSGCIASRLSWPRVADAPRPPLATATNSL